MTNIGEQENKIDCSICLTEIKEGENNYKLECGHSFHTNCIINWFRLGKGTCPMCRNNPEHKNQPQLFFDKRLLTTYIICRVEFKESYSEIMLNDKDSSLQIFCEIKEEGYQEGKINGMQVGLITGIMLGGIIAISSQLLAKR